MLARLASACASFACDLYSEACLAIGALGTLAVGVPLAELTARVVAPPKRQAPPATKQAPTPIPSPPTEPILTIDDAVRHCLRSSDFSSLQHTGPADPCHMPSGLNLYFSGSDIAATTTHIRTAILQKNLPALLHRRDINPPWRKKDARSNCPGIKATEWCDEDPVFSTEENAQYAVSCVPVRISDQPVVYRNS